MSTETTGLEPAELAYSLVEQIRRMGERAQEALRNMEKNIERVNVALEKGEQVFGGYRVEDDPIQLLRDMEPLIGLALRVGVPMETIVKARRGDFVAFKCFEELA